MENVMTIQMFSIRTGLPPSTLRYYEKEKIIIPQIRGDNGYRYYTELQVPIALTIHSLRQADINLQNIRSFLASNEIEKTEWIQKWREEIDAKMASLRIARQYLHGIESDDPYVRLIRWENPVSFIWYPLRVKRELNPYAIAIAESADLFYRESGNRSYEAFIRTDTVSKDEMIGKIGFRLPISANSDRRWRENSRGVVQQFEPTLFVTLECLTADAFACFNLMLLLQKFGFEPAGQKMERYLINDLSTYQWMIPVMHAGALPHLS